MKRFEIYLKEKNGDLDYIQFEKTLEEAEKTVRLFEMADEEDGCYIPNSYVIKEVEDTYATEILNNLFSNFNATFSNNLN